MVIVCKFGGSSITSESDLERIAKIVKDDDRRKVIVVSAPGKRNPEDRKVTDMLIELARAKEPAAAGSLITKITGRYKALAPKDNITEQLLYERVKKHPSEDASAYEDSLKSFGEEACARVLAQRCGFEYVDPRELLLVTSDFGNARILPESKRMIRKRIGDNVAVVPGFYGYTAEGKIATFSRGGSDLTGAYIAAALNAEEYENFTDSGVLAADPNIVKDPVAVTEMTFKEMRDLSYSGFGIFHPEAMRPVATAGTPVHIRSTKHYPKEGTFIVYDRVGDPKKPIVGVAYQGGFCSFGIESHGLNDIKGVLASITGVFSDSEISIEHVITGIDDVSVILKQNQLNSRHKIGAVANRLRAVAGDDADVEFQDNLGCLVVAGKGLRNNRGISSEIEHLLEENGVDILFQLEGVRRRSIIYGISDADAKKAVNLVYDRLFK